MTEPERTLMSKVYDDCITLCEVALEPCGMMLAEKIRRRKEQMLNA